MHRLESIRLFRRAQVGHGRPAQGVKPSKGGSVAGVREWPPGELITYVVSADLPGTETGVIAGRPEHSTKTGRVLVPVRGTADPEGAVTRWVAMSDIVAATDS